MSGQESVMMAVSAAIVLWWVTYSLVLRFHFFSSLSNMTSMMSSDATSPASEIMGGGRIRGWSVGLIGNADSGEGAEEGRFHRQESVLMDATCQC